MTHIIDFKSKTKVLHKGMYENTILQSPYDYVLSTVQTESHISEQYFYDIRDLDETSNFIRFVAVNENGDGSQYVINKAKMSLSPINGQSVFHWKRACQKRQVRSIEGAFETLLEQ